MRKNGAHPKQSVISELSHDASFDAERLIALHSIADSRERQISRLRQEEATLQQVVDEQLEIIKSFGSSIPTTTTNNNNNQSDELFSDNTEVIVQTKIVHSGSTDRLLDGDKTKPKLKQSTSAADLLADITQSIAHQSENEVPLLRHAHSFSQSRQNFYNAPPLQTIVDELYATSDFSDFFQKYPLPLLLFAGFYEGIFPVQDLIQKIEDWTAEKRDEFITQLLMSMERFAEIIKFIRHLADSSSSSELTDLCEVQLATLFAVKRSCYLQYDSVNEELTFFKEQIQLRFPLKTGVFKTALTSQNAVEFSSEGHQLSDTDKNILQTNETALIVPILSIRSKFDIDGFICLFDKQHGFQPVDYLISSLIARFISELIPLIREKEDSKRKFDLFESAIDNFVSLSKTHGLSGFVELMKTLFTQHFNCEDAKLFKVHENETFQRVGTKGLEGKTYPIQKSIIGQSIVTSHPISLSKPQFSEHFFPDVDCHHPNTFSSSILACPILNNRGTATFVFALYNKQNQNAFTKQDEEALRTIAEYIHPVLKSAWQNHIQKQQIKKSKQHVIQAKALIEVIASQKDPTDLNTLIDRMNNFFSNHSAYTELKLYLVQRFRHELLVYQTGCIDTIKFSEDHPAVKCALTGKFITKEEAIFWPIFDSRTSVIAVFELTGMTTKAPEEFYAVPLLNTFRSNLGTSSLLTFEEPLQEEEQTGDEDQWRMIGMWQKVAGSVIEGMNKHQAIMRKKHLIDMMNNSLFENQFEASFHVWQEVQPFIDKFEPLQASYEIESPVIEDIVFASTPELTEKMVHLIQTLQQINPIDQSYFDIREQGFIDDSMVVEESTPSIVDLEISEQNESKRFQALTSVFSYLYIQRTLGVNDEQMTDFLCCMRSLHPDRPFQNWELAVDHFLFAAQLLSSSAFRNSMTETDIIGLLMFLLSLYAEPLLTLKPNPEQLSRYTLETSGQFSRIATFFVSCAFSSMNILEGIGPDERAAIFNTIEVLEVMTIPDSFYDGSPLELLCSLAQQSYLFREKETARSCLVHRLEEEELDGLVEDSESALKTLAQIERDQHLLPLLSECIAVDPSLSYLEERLIVNLDFIING